MKIKTVFTCQKCGYQSAKWLGRCPDCSNWNSFAEESFQPLTKSEEKALPRFDQKPVLLSEVESQEDNRLKTNIEEVDRVLGGGVVPGSIVLMGGEPGIGKSTLSLQISNNLSKQGHTVLYVSGEESAKQTKLRANRLGESCDNLYIVNQVDLTAILEAINSVKAEVVIIDSIQVIFHPGLSSSPGSVSQVRECSGILARQAKAKGTSIFLIGHVTKEGSLAGPRILEHIVDTVFYFEGERYSSYRALRVIKNRFGSTNEIGVFEMTNEGLKEIPNPSFVLLSERPKGEAGSVVSCILEGTRPLLVEIQALVSKSGFGFARRRAQGFDFNRLCMLVAVLEKRLKLRLQDEDVFVNIAGGIRMLDPAADLAIALAIASALRDKAVPQEVIVLGEVGLTGEVRSITQPVLRLKEAARLGFKECILPKNNLKNISWQKEAGLRLSPVETLSEASRGGLK